MVLPMTASAWAIIATSILCDERFSSLELRISPHLRMYFSLKIRAKKLLAISFPLKERRIKANHIVGVLRTAQLSDGVH